MRDLQSELQTAVGDAYRIDKELGGGGMSRLFLATEASLNRRVVIKVLPPELGGEVSAARFRREIELSAQLQHPHILPILGAASRAGLLYYVMPFVAGESLRHRLTREGPLPVADAVRILREIADALAYAHRNGIVHRDIKPENILLLEEHAVLADFGVARALAAAGGWSGTGTGMAIGTPGYMAPEQATGERDVDARADVYALAVVGYEMLTGAPPFTGPTAQAVIAAHLTTPPPPIAEARHDVPPHVSAAIARALAKSPDDRFQSAGGFRDALEAAPRAADTVGGAAFPRPRPSRPWLVAAGIALLVTVGGATFVMLAGSRHEADVNLVAVAPFDVLAPELQLWREGLVDVLSRNLDGAGPLRTVPASAIIKGWEGRADRASAAELGREHGAGIAVYGSLEKFAGDSVRVVASLVDARAGNAVGEVQVKESAARMDRLADSLSVRVLREIGRSRPIGAARLASLGSSSLPAIKAFLQGEQHYRRAAWDSAAFYLERAVSEDSTFALALRRLSSTYAWKEDTQNPRAIALAIRASKYNQGLAPRDSMLIVADSLYRSMRPTQNDSLDIPTALPRQRRLFATLEEFVRRYPADAEGWFMLGDYRYHAGTVWGMRGTDQRVLADFERAIAADSTLAAAYVHPVDIAFRLNDPAAAVRFSRGYLAHHPSDPTSDAIRLAAYLADSANRGTDLRALSDTAPMQTLTRAMNVMGFWRDSAETVLNLGRAMVRPGRKEYPFGMDPSIAPGYLLNWLPYRGHAKEAAAMVLRFRSRLKPEERPQATFSMLDLLNVQAMPADSLRSQLRLERGGFIEPEGTVAGYAGFWAAERDTAALRAAARTLDSLARLPLNPRRRFRVQRWVSYMPAYQALARGDTAEAVRRFDAAPDSLDLDPHTWLPRARLLAAQGRDEDAFRELDRPYQCVCATFVVMAYERGRLAERLGDDARAIEDYGIVVDAWRHADPELQPMVREARAGLQRLSDERRDRAR